MSETTTTMRDAIEAAFDQTEGSAPAPAPAPEVAPDLGTQEPAAAPAAPGGRRASDS